jgi:hypothetical protein
MRFSPPATHICQQWQQFFELLSPQVIHHHLHNRSEDALAGESQVQDEHSSLRLKHALSFVHPFPPGGFSPVKNHKAAWYDVKIVFLKRDFVHAHQLKRDLQVSGGCLLLADINHPRNDIDPNYPSHWSCLSLGCQCQCARAIARFLMARINRSTATATQSARLQYTTYSKKAKMKIDAAVVS